MAADSEVEQGERLAAHPSSVKRALPSVRSNAPGPRVQMLFATAEPPDRSATNQGGYATLKVKTPKRKKDPRVLDS